jgi:hypothetical protein
LPQALPQPATFRPQGLVTLAAAYSLRARAGLLSCRRRSWDSPFGAFSFRKVSATFPGGCTHTPFFPSVSPAAKRWAGPTGRGLWVLTLPGVPRGNHRISAEYRRMLPWALPSQGFQPRLCAAFTSAPPSRFREPVSRPASPAPRSINQPQPDLVRRPANRLPDEATLTGFSHRNKPASFERNVVRAICFTLRRVAHYCRPPTRLGRSRRSTGVARVCSEVPTAISHLPCKSFC